VHLESFTFIKLGDEMTFNLIFHSPSIHQLLLKELTMIISELNYQEMAVEATNLEGGINLGASISTWDYSSQLFGTVSAAGPGGSYAATGVAQLDISSLGASLVVLGL